MGLKVTTDGRPVTVYASKQESRNGETFFTYAIGIASKDMAGNWVNGYLDCRFRNGVVIKDKTKINISNSFYTVSEHKGKKHIKLFILDFEIVESPAQVASDADGFLSIPDGIEDELPFY